MNNSDDIDALIEQLRNIMPPVLIGKNINTFTGGAVLWATIQNLHSLNKIPDDIFLFYGRKKLIQRDPFLAWWKTRLRQG